MEAKKIYAPNELIGSQPDHPGEMLKDELQARGISQKRFAELIGVSHTVLNEVLNGKRPITTEYALKIEAATGINARIWIGLQADYNLETALRDNKFSAVLDKIRKAVAVL